MQKLNKAACLLWNPFLSLKIFCGQMEHLHLLYIPFYEHLIFLDVYIDHISFSGKENPLYTLDALYIFEYLFAK